MAYTLFLLANFALFVRLGEISPLFQGVQLYLYLIVAALICSGRTLQQQVSRRAFLQQPTNLCVIGVMAGVAMSHLSLMYLYGLRTGVIDMAKVAAYYLLLVGLVNTPLRMRRFLMCTALSASVMILFSVWDFSGFVIEWDGSPGLEQALFHDANLKADEEPLLRHIVELNPGQFTDAGDLTYVYRMKGLGIFSDPNDVALLIVVTSIICLFFLTDRKLGAVRYLWVSPLILMTVALACTQSRGGILAAGVAGTVWLAARYGRGVAIALGVLGAMCLPIALGRAGDIELSTGTGQSRIQLWSEGLAELKSPRVLFGIGTGMYEDYAGLVAHNSYVHAFVEMGFFGGTLFFGCVFFPSYALWRMSQDKLQIQDAELRRLRPYIAAMLACWCMGMCTLSRCYVESTYMIIGVSAAYVNLVGFHQRRPRPVVLFNQLSVSRWLLCSFGLFFGCFVFVRLFAHWGG